MTNYDEFLTTKQDFGASCGFDPLFMPDSLFDFQQALTEWAIRKGRAAIFADCGMGKTLMQLVWAENVVRHTNKPVLILTPLAVSGQTIEEAEKFGMVARRAIPGVNGSPAIKVTNYEQLHHYDARHFAGVVCDESSILKNFRGTRKTQITEFMRRVPYRLLCTATAAPNDWEELGTSSEALGYLGYTDMLTRYFTNKSNTVATRRFQNNRDKFNLRAHAAHDFWRWTVSWSRAARYPADLGFDNDGFILPALIEKDEMVYATRPRQGMLFDVAPTTFHEVQELIRRTVPERCEAAAEKVAQHDVSMVWCHRNDEATLLKDLIPNSVEISGSDSEEARVEAVRWFKSGAESKRVLISKPRIFGLGLNFQHCAHATYFPTDSYEQYYQATRRLWRFGQEKQVQIDRIYTDGGERILDNLDRKAENAVKMFELQVKYMNDALSVRNVYKPQAVEVPAWLK